MIYDPVPHTLCTNANINGGLTKTHGCSGVICPLGTYSDPGHATHADGCKPCPPGKTTVYLGSSTCIKFDENDYLGKQLYEHTDQRCRQKQSFEWNSTFFCFSFATKLWSTTYYTLLPRIRFKSSTGSVPLAKATCVNGMVSAVTKKERWNPSASPCLGCKLSRNCARRKLLANSSYSSTTSAIFLSGFTVEFLGWISSP